MLFASLQATALLCVPLAAALVGSPTAAWIFFATSIYFAASQATGPAWNTWICPPSFAVERPAIRLPTS